MEDLCVNNLRILALNEIEKAGSGHPGVALSGAPIFYSLYANVMNYNISDDKNIFRDRFVVSAGHSSSLVYATLNMFGFELPMEELKNFRQLNSKTPGHPEYDRTCGVDCSTGPLGQGVANAVGMAIAGKYYQAKFNKEDIKLFDNKVYCFVGDGCLMEGISYEAISLAGNLKLDNLVLIYDYNKRTIDGSTDITFTEDVKKRFEAINFEIFEVMNGNSVSEITENLLKAKNSSRPSIVIVNTKLGYGSEFEDDSLVHGKPLNKEQIEFVKNRLNIKVNEFEILPEVKKFVDEIKDRVKQRFDNQLQLLKDYEKKYPNDYQTLIDYLNFNFNQKNVDILKNLQVNNENGIREINNEIFSSIDLPNMLGGCADVESSTKVYNKKDKIFDALNYDGKRIHYGIREHAMAGISNGITLFGGLLAYTSCFFSFVDYLKPSLRMSSLMNLPVLYVFTHDSVSIGEDGPTHQPVEQLISVNYIPNLQVFRCYNSDEIKFAYSYFLTHKKPTIIILSRNKYETLNTNFDDIKFGAYKVYDCKKENHINLVATGSEVEVALKVKNLLEQSGIFANVISMPNVKLFESQTDDYKQSLLPKNVKTFTIEYGLKENLERYSYNGKSFSVNSFGESGKSGDVISYFNLSPEQICSEILKKI